jgi:hypothetical protein
MTTSRHMVYGGSEARKAGHRSIKQHPWLGTGLGTFRWVFPAYRNSNGAIPAYGTVETDAQYDVRDCLRNRHLIHNIGHRGMARCLHCPGARNDRAEARRELPAAAFWIGLLAVLRSLVDFSLQIPGFSLAILPLVGMGLAQSKSSKSPALNTGTGFNRSRGSGTIQFAEFHLNS